MQEKQLKELIVKRLAEISLLKGIELKEEHYTTWANKIINDYNSGLIQTFNDIKNGFKKLESEKSYGGLDYAIFFEGAKKNLDQLAEKEWSEVLNFKPMGNTQISLKSKLVMRNLGGMNWLWDSMKNEIDFKKRNFIDAWKNTQEPIEDNFRCQGVDDNRVYLPENNIKQIDG